MKYFSWVFLFTSLILGFADNSFADPWKNLSQGDKTASEFLKNLDKKKTEAGPHPFYNGKTPKESNFKDSELKGKAQSAALQNQAGQMVYESQNARSQFKIDPQTDPLLSVAEKIMKTPLTEIGGTGTSVVETTQGGKDEIITCEEAGDNSLESCTHDLKVTVQKIKVKKEWSGAFVYSKCCNAERRGHYLPCSSLRATVGVARRALSGRRTGRHGTPIDINTALNITGPYKACMTELSEAKKGGCSEGCRTALPQLPFNANQIKEIILTRDPNNTRKILMRHRYFHMYHSGRTEYNFQPYIKIIYEEDSYKILPDEWISNCDHLESRADTGLCSYASKVCSVGKETRVIEGVPIARDCWQKTFTYSCSYPSKDNCGPLRARGCVQINSTCKQMVGKACVLHEQTYQCKEPIQTKHQIVGGKTPFCLDGNCRDQSWDPNNELGLSIAQLSLLKEIQGKFDINNPTIFNGKKHSCSKYVLSFKDCCGSGKGWGNDIGLSSCSKDEKTLRKLRKERLCHYVGTYCSHKQKITGICLEKKSAFCCFGSKLLKAFHEQGRAQIRMGWGEPKEPLCRGFTINEIQRIDFSKMDLSEVFEDLMKAYSPAKMKNMNPAAKDKIEKTDLDKVGKKVIKKSRATQMQDLSKRVGERVEVLKKGMAPHGK